MQILSVTNLAGPAGIRVNGRTASALALTTHLERALAIWSAGNAMAAAARRQSRAKRAPRWNREG